MLKLNYELYEDTNENTEDNTKELTKIPTKTFKNSDGIPKDTDLYLE